jgi:hypothetical protein
MKERKGPFGLMVGGIVDSVVQTARRRALDREPRALVYDADGQARLVKPGEPGGEELVETAGKLIDLAGSPAADEPADADVEAEEAAAEADAQTAPAGEEGEVKP